MYNILSFYDVYFKSKRACVIKMCIRKSYVYLSLKIRCMDLKNNKENKNEGEYGSDVFTEDSRYSHAAITHFEADSTSRAGEGHYGEFYFQRGEQGTILESKIPKDSINCKAREQDTRGNAGNFPE